MHFLGEQKAWECIPGGRVFPIPESLTRASGVFTPYARACAREILDQGKKGVDQGARYQPKERRLKPIL